MTYDEVRALFLRALGSGVDRDGAHEVYHDDAILEFPQSGERFRGKANMKGFRERYPARVEYEPREIRGSGDVWVAEGRALYDGGDPQHFVWIAEFRDGLVQRETIYFAPPFPAPEWRRPWAEEDPAWERQPGLPARVVPGDRGAATGGRPSAG